MHRTPLSIAAHSAGRPVRQIDGSAPAPLWITIHMGRAGSSASKMMTFSASTTMSATAGNSRRLPRVAVFSASRYQLVPCVRWRHAPPSLSNEVS